MVGFQYVQHGPLTASSNDKSLSQVKNIRAFGLIDKKALLHQLPGTSEHGQIVEVQ